MRKATAPGNASLAEANVSTPSVNSAVFGARVIARTVQFDVIVHVRRRGD
ncbi:hypothetical protein [Mycobacterium leprae]|nr:hypothetical protein [Mycobacterium leprae]